MLAGGGVAGGERGKRAGRRKASQAGLPAPRKPRAGNRAAPPATGGRWNLRNQEGLTAPLSGAKERGRRGRQGQAL
eukprot:2360435-Pyramimonas_sp.AAC.1